MKQFEYKFVDILFKHTLNGIKAEDDYEEVIRIHALSGWKLHTIFHPTYKPKDKKYLYQIIFEKQVEE